MKDKDVLLYSFFAKEAAKRSHAKRLKVGAVLVNEEDVMVIGYNGTPKDWDNNCETEQNTTKPEVIHAEMNAMFKFMRSGLSTENTTLFMTHSPCIECAKAIHLAKVKVLYYFQEYRSLEGMDFLKKSGVTIIKIDERSNLAAEEIH